MSRTDNTRPWFIQRGDTTLPGQIYHSHNPNQLCNFSPTNHLEMHIGWKGGIKHREFLCAFQSYHMGGERGYNGHGKMYRKQQRRILRRRSNQMLRKMAEGEIELDPTIRERRSLALEMWASS